MALFENLGKKVSSLAQDAVDGSIKLAQATAAKSKNVAEITRLKAAINDEKREIRHGFAKLGKACYESHKNNTSAEVNGLCAGIDAHYEELKNLEDRLNQQRGVVICPECGIEIEGECKFCPDCGAQLPEIVKAAATVEDIIDSVSIDVDDDDEDDERHEHEDKEDDDKK